MKMVAIANKVLGKSHKTGLQSPPNLVLCLNNLSVQLTHFLITLYLSSIVLGVRRTSAILVGKPNMQPSLQHRVRSNLIQFGYLKGGLPVKVEDGAVLTVGFPGVPSESQVSYLLYKGYISILYVL